MAIVRNKLLREQVRDAVLERVIGGDLRPHERINESWLATELGVSRTPLREALNALTSEGLLRSEAGRGYFVEPMTREELTSIYPIIGALEALAVRKAEPTAEDLAELERINAEMEASAADPLRCMELDDEWHARLVAVAHDEHLAEVIRAQKRRVDRYEYQYMRRGETIRESVRQHAAVIEALAAGDRERATRSLEENWAWGMACLLAIVDESEPA